MKNKGLITRRKKVIRKSPAENEFLMIEITKILINNNYYFFPSESINEKKSNLCNLEDLPFCKNRIPGYNVSSFWYHSVIL